MSTFDGEDKRTLYDGKDCMKKFCTSLREHTEKIIDVEKWKISPLTKNKLKSHQDAKACYVYGKRILRKLSKCINYQKIATMVILQVNIEAQHIVFVI